MRLLILYMYVSTAVILKPFFQFIVDKLFWPETLLLEAVGQHEPQVDALRERMSTNISAAIIPAKAYAQQYIPYLDLINLDIKVYIR